MEWNFQRDEWVSERERESSNISRTPKTICCVYFTADRYFNCGICTYICEKLIRFHLHKPFRRFASTHIGPCVRGWCSLTVPTAVLHCEENMLAKMFRFGVVKVHAKIFHQIDAMRPRVASICDYHTMQTHWICWILMGLCVGCDFRLENCETANNMGFSKRTFIVDIHGNNANGKRQHRVRCKCHGEKGRRWRRRRRQWKQRRRQCQQKVSK